MFNRFSKLVLGLALAASVATGAAAENIGSPEGDVILTVSGEISQTNQGDVLALDLDMLKAMPATTFKTSTIWTDGVHAFTGVSLADFAAYVGFEEGQILATAINDYTVEIPFGDAVQGGPIVAYLMDDKTMSVRDKGPLWIVYPYDSSSAYRSEVIYSRSIWQLDRIEIVK